MDSFFRRRTPLQQDSPTPPRTRSRSSYAQFMNSHPYATACGPSPSDRSSSPHRPSRSAPFYDADAADHYALPPQPRPVDATAALQQQYETTRLLSRLLAGVTLQWREVVDQLNDAQVPLTTSTRKQTEEASPLRRSATNTSTHSTNTYLNEELRFDVRGRADRRRAEQEREALVERRARERQKRRYGDVSASAVIEAKATSHPYDRHNTRTPRAEKQLDAYIVAEAAEDDQAAVEAERQVAGVSNWRALAPSAQWVPYVVGPHGSPTTSSNSSSRHGGGDGGEKQQRRQARVADDAWYDGRYDGVLYASPNNHSHNDITSATADGRNSRGGRSSQGYRSPLRGNYTRCAECDDAAEAAHVDPDDATRLRTAVLHGMARSAEKMVMGMRQVQHLLPALTASATLNEASGTEAEVMGRQRGSPTRPHRQRGRHQSPNTTSLEYRRLPQSSPSPQPRRGNSHNASLTFQDDDQRLHHRSKSRHHQKPQQRSRSAGDVSGNSTVVFPALPAAQRTWIYPHIDDSTGVEHTSKEIPLRPRHPATPTVTQAGSRGAVRASSPSSPALHDVTPITEKSLGVSIATDHKTHVRHKGVDSPLSFSVRPTATSPFYVRRQLEWRHDARAEAAPPQRPTSDATVADRAPRRLITVVATSSPSENKKASDEPVSRAHTEQLVWQARTAALVHAEREARLCLTVHHESKLRALMQAHYHQLWQLTGRESGAHKRVQARMKDIKAAEEMIKRESTHNETAKTTTKKKSKLPLVETSSPPTSSPLAPSVSLSPFSSPSATRHSSPVAPRTLRTAHDSLDGVSARHVADNPSRNALRNLQSPAMESTPTANSSHAAPLSAATTSKTTSTSSSSPSSPTAESVLSLQGPDNADVDSVESTLARPPSSPSKPSSSAMSHADSHGRSSCSPTSEKRAPSRSQPPPPPTPPPPQQQQQRTVAPLSPTPLRQSPISPPPASFVKVLISPLDEHHAFHRSDKQRTASWDIHIPPAEVPERSLERSPGASERARRYLKTYTDHLAATSTSQSPVSQRRPKSRSAERAAQVESSALAEVATKDDNPLTSDRGGVVALELFPSTISASRTPIKTPKPLLPSCDDTQQQQHQQQRSGVAADAQHSSPLLSPSPLRARDNTSAENAATMPTVIPLREDMITASSRPCRAAEAGSEHEVTICAGGSASATYGGQSRGALRQSMASTMEKGSPALPREKRRVDERQRVATIENQRRSVDNSITPSLMDVEGLSVLSKETHTEGSCNADMGQPSVPSTTTTTTTAVATTASRIADQRTKSQEDSTSSDSESSSRSIQYRIESGSAPPVSEAVFDDDARFSSVSSVYSSVQECLTAPESSVEIAAKQSKTSPTVNAVKNKSGGDCAVETKKTEAASAAVMVDATCVTEVSVVEGSSEELPSPLPRPPTIVIHEK